MSKNGGIGVNRGTDKDGINPNELAFTLRVCINFPLKNDSSILLDLFKYKGAARISNIMGRKHWVLFGIYIATV